MSDDFMTSDPYAVFFRQSLSNLTAARDLLQAHLSPAVTQRLQWETLRFMNESYLGEEHKHLRSDVVYTCQLDDEKGPYIYIYVLLEQQSTPDPLLPFYFLQCNVALMTEHFARNEQEQHTRPPIVLNLCLYMGGQAPYPDSAELYDCFADPALAREEFPKGLLLVELDQMSEEELRRHGTADLLELLLKQGQERTFLSWLKENPAVAIKMMDNSFGIYGIYSLVFILELEQNHSPEEILETMGKIVPYKKKDIMTAAQQLRQEGIQEGIRAGMHAKALEIASNMLSNLHLDMKIVSAATGLSAEELMQLQEEPNR
jgi:predicted transposase/invertase (TIGR01784 family)